jgi:NhaP-type Na+/H+ or K+/H+ antiporter
VESSEIVQGIGLVVVLGVGLQWLARWLHVPSILLLLAGGLAVGPGLGWLDPDEVFGDTLFPVVSLAVGVLLFNGGMELRFADLRGAARAPVLRLVTVGALATWLLTAAAAHLIFHEPVRLSLLLGAVLVVSGPTVVGPLLRVARPTDPAGTILRWEGIVIDPLGATLGLFCVNAFFVAELSAGEIWRDVVVVALAGVAAGLVGAALLVTALRRLAVPADLEVAVALMLVVAAYVVAEVVRPEAGLFATTTMGLALANQRVVPTAQLRVFGEPIVALLIGSLFIVLAARVEAEPLIEHLPEVLVLATVLVVVIRPLVVAACTLGQRQLALRDRAYLACLAPRGVVAAATAALFSLRLEQIGQASDVLLPAVFAVVIVLAVVYGLGALPAARWLGVARPDPRGALVVSDHGWALGLGGELARHGVPTLVVARGRRDLEGRDDLPFAVHTGLIRELAHGEWLADIGGAVIASRDDAVDFVALDLAVNRFGRRRVWVLPSEPPDGVDDDLDLDMWAPLPFAADVTHDRLDDALTAGHAVRTVDAGSIGGAMVLAVITPDGRWTADVDGPFPPGARVVVLDPAPRPGDGGDGLPSVQRDLEGDQDHADQAGTDG